MADIEDDDITTSKRMTKQQLQDQAMEQFDTAVIPLAEERALCLQDRRFASIAGAQWEDEWQLAFENSIRVEINKTRIGLEKIYRDYRENRVTVNYRATDAKASDDTAGVLDGMFRADVYRCKGGQAFDNAFIEGTSGGMGAWRVVNEWEDEYDPENDHQRIAFRTIVDADQSVFFDPNSKLYDKSDAEFAFVITAMSPAAFKKEWGDGRISSWPDGVPKPHYDWYTPEVIRVAERYQVEITSETKLIFQHVATDEQEWHYESDLTPEHLKQMKLDGWKRVTKRPVKRKRIRKTKHGGMELLKDCGYIAGSEIPIVFYAGHREYIDNMERLRGHVRSAKDPQRVYNAQISKLTETASLAPLERPIFDPEQVQGLEQHWAEMNINRAPYALARALRDADGNIIQSGPIGKVEPPQLSPVLSALVQITAQDIAELTNSDDNSDQVKSNISAEAMDIAATRTDAKSGIFMDNFRQSMQRCGEIYLGMVPDVYYEEGREVETLGEDGEEGTEKLAEPHTDPITKEYGVRNDLSKGRYKVISDVTEATATRRDKTVKTMFGVAQSSAAMGDMETAQAALITGVLNMDGEGVADFQKFMRKKALAIGLVEPTDEEAQAMQEAAQGQQPDATQQALQAQAMALAAEAEKNQALTGKAKADTIKSLVQADEIRAGISRDDQQAAHSRNIDALDGLMRVHDSVQQAVAPAQGMDRAA
jgi:hypothetical protein